MARKEVKKILESVTETVDPATGEVTTFRKKYSIKVKVDNFYLSFIDNMSGYFKVTSGVDKNVLAKLCCLAEYDTGRVFVRAADRKAICMEFGISYQQFGNSISSLKSLNMITGERGFYKINPAVFWKGSSKTRYSLLMDKDIAVEFNFEVDCPEFNSNIEPQND